MDISKLGFTNIFFFSIHVKKESLQQWFSKVRSVVKETECKLTENSHDKGKLTIKSENEN